MRTARRPGDRLGRFTLIRPNRQSDGGSNGWVAQCDCGRLVVSQPVKLERQPKGCRRCLGRSLRKRFRCRSCGTTLRKKFYRSKSMCMACQQRSSRARRRQAVAP